MKIHKTSKLFYRKYPYKIELNVKGAEYVKRNSHDEIVDMCLRKKSSYWFERRGFTDTQRQSLIDFSKLVNPILERGHKLRVEMNTMSFYLTDETVYHDLVKELEPFVKSVTVPESDEDLEKLFSKNHIIVCDKLPFGKYVYKLMLKTNLSDTAKENLVRWLETSDDFKVPKKTGFWLRGHQRWIYDPYVYARSSKHLTILGLFLGSSVKRTYEYVLRDTQINSVSEEQLCQI